MIENKKESTKEMCEDKACPDGPPGESATNSSVGGTTNGHHITGQPTSIVVPETATESTTNDLLNGHHPSDDCGRETMKESGSSSNYAQRLDHHSGDDSGGEMSPMSADSGVISPSSTPDVMTPGYESSQQTLSAGTTDGDSGKQLVARTTPLTADGTEEVVLIQDTSFNIKIVAPGCDPFDLQVCAFIFILYG